MKNKILFLLLASILITNISFASLGISATEIKTIDQTKNFSWQSEILIDNLESEIKIYSLEPLIYGYWQKEKWVIYKEKEKFFEAINNNVIIYNTNPRYISYWTKEKEQETLILKTIDGKKINLPEKTQEIALIQKAPSEDIFLQYWLEDLNNLPNKRGLGSVINIKTGKEIFPVKNNYFNFISINIYGNNWYSISQSNGDELLSNGSDIKLIAKDINRPYFMQGNDTKFLIIRENDEDYLLNLETFWKSPKYKRIHTFKDNILIVNKTSHHYYQIGDFKIFYLKGKTLVDITPLNKEFDIIIPVIKDNNECNTTKKLSEFFIKEKLSDIVYLYKFDENGNLDKVEETSFNFKNSTFVYLNAYWQEQKKMYYLWGSIDSKVHFILYDPETKISIDRNLFGSNKEGSLLYNIQVTVSPNIEHKPLKNLVVTDRQGIEIFTFDKIQSGFKNRDGTKFFCKENNIWYFLDIEKKILNIVKDIDTIEPANLSNIAFIKKTNGENGLLILDTNEILTLPADIYVKNFICGIEEKNFVVFETNNNGKKQLLRIFWKNKL